MLADVKRVGKAPLLSPSDLHPQPDASNISPPTLARGQRNQMRDRRATDSPVDLLTQRERDCLGLVATHLKSKEIGKELGLSHHTVNQHIASAVKRLKVANRYKAAALYADYIRNADPEGAAKLGLIPKNRDGANYSVGMANEPLHRFNGQGTEGEFHDPDQFDATTSTGPQDVGRPHLAAHDLGHGFSRASGTGGGISESWTGPGHGLGSTQAIGLLAGRRGLEADPHHGFGRDGRLLPTLNPINDLPVGTRMMFVVAGVVVLSLVFGLINLTVQTVGL